MEETVAPTLLDTIAAFAPKAVVILQRSNLLTSSCLSSLSLKRNTTNQNTTCQDNSRHESKGVRRRVSQVNALLGVAGAWDFSVEPGVHLLWSAAGRNAYSITGPLDGLGSVHVSGCLRMFDLLCCFFCFVFTVNVFPSNLQVRSLILLQ